ncbi:unnamed protein product, partial [Closterium sp. NIES-65]
MDVRTIAIGEVLVRILSRAVCLQLRDLDGEGLLGITAVWGGGTCGTEVVVRGVRRALADHPDWVVLQLDVANAFNSFHRDRMFQALQASPEFQCLIPLHRPLLRDALGSPLQPVLAEGDVQLWSYADDTYVLGPPDRVLHHFCRDRVSAELRFRSEPSSGGAMPWRPCVPVTTSPLHLARLTSLQGGGAGAWLTSVPYADPLRIPEALWQAASSSRLGLPIPQLALAGGGLYAVHTVGGGSSETTGDSQWWERGHGLRCPGERRGEAGQPGGGGQWGRHQLRGQVERGTGGQRGRQGEQTGQDGEGGTAQAAAGRASGGREAQGAALPADPQREGNVQLRRATPTQIGVAAARRVQEKLRHWGPHLEGLQPAPHFYAVRGGDLWPSDHTPCPLMPSAPPAPTLRVPAPCRLFDPPCPPRRFPPPANSLLPAVRSPRLPSPPPSPPLLHASSFPSPTHSTPALLNPHTAPRSRPPML